MRRLEPLNPDPALAKMVSHISVRTLGLRGVVYTIPGGKRDLVIDFGHEGNMTESYLMNCLNGWFHMPCPDGGPCHHDLLSCKTEYEIREAMRLFPRTECRPVPKRSHRPNFDGKILTPLIALLILEDRLAGKKLTLERQQSANAIRQAIDALYEKMLKDLKRAAKKFSSKPRKRH